MIVEDDVDTCNTIKLLLEKSGHEVVATAKDGEEAVELYKETKPAVVIMDILLPKVHGVDAIKQIVDFDPKAKILVITGAVHENLITSALNAGAQSYITKPFGVEEILKEIEKITS